MKKESTKHQIAYNTSSVDLNRSRYPSTLDAATGELGYDGPLYDRSLHMTDDMLGPSPMHIKYLSYAYDRFCI